MEESSTFAAPMKVNSSVAEQVPTSSITPSQKAFNERWGMKVVPNEDLANSNATSQPVGQSDPIYEELPRPARIRLLRIQENSKEHRSLPWILNFDPFRGGVKYVVLLSAFLTLFMFSLTLSASLYNEQLQKEFNVSSADVSNFTSIEFGFFCASSLIIARIIDIIGVLPTLYASLFLITLGQFVTSFVDSFWGVTFVYAVLCGPGASGAQMLGMLMANDWFGPLGQLGLSTGITLGSVGLGNICWTYFMEYLLAEYGWRVCLRYSALFCLCLSIVIVLTANTRSMSVSKTKEAVVDAVNTHVQQEMSVELEVKEEELFGPRPPLLYLSPLFKPRFFIFVVIVLAATFFFYAPYVHLVPAAIAKGHSVSDSSFLLILCGITTMVFRPILGLFADRIGGLTIMLVANIAQLLGCIFWLYATDLWHFQLLGLWLGFSASAYIIGCSNGFLTPTPLVAPFEISSAFGYVFGLAYTPGATAVGNIFGDDFDSNGNYERSLIVFAVVQAVATVLNVIIMLPIWGDKPAQDNTGSSQQTDVEMQTPVPKQHTVDTIVVAKTAAETTAVGTTVDGVDVLAAPEVASPDDPSLVYIYPSAAYVWLRRLALSVVAKRGEAVPNIVAPALPVAAIAQEDVTADKPVETNEEVAVECTAAVDVVGGGDSVDSTEVDVEA